MNSQINRTLRPKWLPRAIREFGPHWVVVQFESCRMDGELDLRQQDFHFSINFANGSFIEPGVNTNLEIIRTPFTLNSARGVRRLQPGRYEFTEYFITYRANDAARVVDRAPLLGSASSTTATSAATRWDRPSGPTRSSTRR